MPHSNSTLSLSRKIWSLLTTFDTLRDCYTFGFLWTVPCPHQNVLNTLCDARGSWMKGETLSSLDLPPREWGVHRFHQGAKFDSEGWKRIDLCGPSSQVSTLFEENQEGRRPDLCSCATPSLVCFQIWHPQSGGRGSRKKADGVRDVAWILWFKSVPHADKDGRGGQNFIKCCLHHLLKPLYLSNGRVNRAYKRDTTTTYGDLDKCKNYGHRFTFHKNTSTKLMRLPSFSYHQTWHPNWLEARRIFIPHSLLRISSFPLMATRSSGR